MANHTQDVELRIRASNYSKKTTDQVVDALNKMTTAQDAQIEAAKQGAATVQQLEKSYTELESAAKALVSQNALIKQFQSQSQVLTELEAKLASARKAQQDFAASARQSQQGMTYNEFKSKNLAEYTRAEGSHAAAMARMSKEWAAYKETLDAGSLSEVKAATEAKKLAQAVAAAEKELSRAEKRIETVKGRMGEFGITADTAADAQQKIVAAVARTNAALERQEAAIATHDTSAAQRRAAAQAQDAADQQTRAAEKVAAAARAAATAIAAQTRAQLEANEAAAMNRVAHEAEMEMLFTNEQRKATEAINRKNAALQAQKLALQQAADAAERMSRSASSTARGTAPVMQSNLAGQIRDIQNPADAATRSVSGIEAAIGRLETRVTQIRGPVKDYRTAVEEATRAQRALNDVAGQVDAYQRQQTAVRAAGTAFGQAQAEVRRLVAEMRAGATGDDITTRLARAQNTLQAAAQRLGNVRTESRAMQAALQAAGVDTNNLTTAEQRLVAQATRATQALNALNQAYRRNGAAADDAGSRIWNWFGGGNGARTTLSYAQRLRGELLSMASGFVGLYAAVGVAQKTLSAYQTNQAILSRLTIANAGDTHAAADEFKYLEAQADRIGFVFQKIAPAYTKFAIAAKSAGFNTQQTHFAFEQIAGSAVKARLSTDELEGVMKAFEQIMSKGTVQAEELRGQLGDRLPGAFQIAARAAKMTVEDYTKAVTDGKIGGDQVIAIARELGKTYGAAQAGTETLLEAQARFENATNRFLSNTGKGGFVEAYQKLLNQLTTMLNDGTADKFAQNLSSALTAVVNILRFVADNIDGVKFAIEALIAVKVIRWLLTLPSLFVAVRNEILLATFAIQGFQAWLGRAAAANALAGALGAGGLSGVAVKLRGYIIKVGQALLVLATRIPILAAAAIAATALGSAINYGIDKYDENAVNGLAKSIDDGTAAMKEAYAAREKYDAARGKAEEAALKKEYERKRDIAVAATKAADKAIADARAKGVTDQGYGAMTNPVVTEALSRRDKFLDNPVPTTAAATADPGDPDNSRQQMSALRKKLDAEDKKSERQSRLARLKAEKGDLAERLEIIREPFDALKEQYKASMTNTEEYNKAIVMIDASYAKAAKTERDKYNAEQSKSGESAAKKREQLAQEIGLKLKEIEDDVAKRQAEADPTAPFEERRLARVTAIGNAYDEVMKKILKEQKINPEQAKKDEAKLKLLTQQRKDLEDQNAYRDEANKLLDEYNKKQGILNSNIAAINAEADNGFITQAEAAQRVNEQIREYAPGVKAAGEEALKFAALSSNMLDPTRFAEIVSTIRQGMAKNNGDAQVAVNSLNSGQQQLNELLAQQQREVDAINLKRKLGLIDANTEADMLNANSYKYAQSIQMLAQNLLNFVATVRAQGGMPAEQLAVIEASANRVLTTTKAGIQSSKEWETALVGSVAQNGATAFDQMAQSIAGVITGQQGIAAGFKGMMQAAGQFFASLLKDIAMAIIKMQILKLLQGMGGGIGAAATAAMPAAGAVPVAHAGAVIGAPGGRSRSNVAATAFAGAVRYHTGGIAGFAPNEVPAVLQKGEEVLTRDDPRNILNAGSQMAQAAQQQQSQRFVLVDDRSQVPQAMASSEGEKVTLVHLKNNLPTIKQWMK